MLNNVGFMHFLLMLAISMLLYVIILLYWCLEMDSSIDIRNDT